MANWLVDEGKKSEKLRELMKMKANHAKHQELYNLRTRAMSILMQNGFKVDEIAAIFGMESTEIRPIEKKEEE